MRTRIILGLLFVLTICFLGAQSIQTHPFEGNWELLSSTGTVVEKGELININFKKDANNKSMKLIHGNYFMFVGQEMTNGVASSHYGYGTYTFKDNIYTEHIIYISGEAFAGKTPSYEMTVKGDTLIQKGPLKIGDFKDSKTEFTETYVRK